MIQMRIMNIRYSNKKKVRGAKRKCHSMISNIYMLTEYFPDSSNHREYWHMHLPVAQTFIDSTKTPAFARKECIQTLINRVKHLIENRPEKDSKARVVVCINWPNLWHSQIIVFFSEDYFKGFFDRNNDYQKWTQLSQKRSLSKELNLIIPEGFMENGYLEKIFDEDFKSVSELWYFGELV